MEEDSIGSFFINSSSSDNLLSDERSSSALMGVKKTRSLDNIFIFKDPKKSLKKTPLGLFS